MVDTTSTDSSSSLGHVNGSRESTTRSARKPGSSRPRRRSSPASQAGVTVDADDRLLDRERLVDPPGRAVVDRAQHAGTDPGQRVELLDGCVGAVGDDGARVQQAPERVGALERFAPEPLRQVPVGGRVRELDRAGDADLGEPGNVRGVEALRVLDPVPKPSGPQSPASPRRRPAHRGSLGRRSRAPRPASRRAAAPRIDAPRAPRALVIWTPVPSSIEGGLRAERPVHEGLQIAEAQEVVADTGPQPECRELGHPVGGQRLPDPQRRALPARGCGRRSRRRRASRPCRGSRRRPARWRRGCPRASASTHSSSVTVTQRSRKRQADSSRRTPVGSPSPSRSTTPPGTSRSPRARARAAVLSQSEW